MKGLTELLKGALEGCVLELIGREETYGYEITRRLNAAGLDDVVEGTVYTILLRLEKNGLVEVVKKRSDLGPPRKFYTLNAAGQAELANFWERWSFVTHTIDQLHADTHQRSAAVQTDTTATHHRRGTSDSSASRAVADPSHHHTSGSDHV